MIARHWRGFASAENADTYLDHLRQSTFPQLEEIGGHRGGVFLRRDDGDGVEFVVLTLWHSLDAIRAFAGGDHELAVVPPEARRALASFDERVTHYDVAEITIGPMGGRPGN